MLRWRTIRRAMRARRAMLSASMATSSPWTWLVNFWYFLPEVRRRRGDAYVKQNALRSLYGFVAASVALLLWMGVYQIGGSWLLGNLYDELDVSALNLGQYDVLEHQY